MKVKKGDVVTYNSGVEEFEVLLDPIEYTQIKSKITGVNCLVMVDSLKRKELSALDERGVEIKIGDDVYLTTLKKNS